jgi:predicted dehydrogenase
MKNARIKVALVGYGYWGVNLLRNMFNHPALEVVGVVERDAKARERCQTNYPQIYLTDDLEIFLKAGKVDAVVIATPPNTHCEIAVTCLRAGCHVLIEKPMALSVAECDQILAQARLAKRIVMVDHTFVYHPAITFLAEQIHSGKMGELQFYDSTRVNLGGFQLTNVLWDLAPHDLSILDLLMQQRLPTQVSAHGVRHFGAPSETMCYVTLLYERNVIAHLHLNWAAPVKVRQIMLGGTEKMAIYDDNNPVEKVRIYDRSVKLERPSELDFKINYRIGDMVAPAIRQTEALANMMNEFVTCIQTGKTPLADGTAGRRVLQVLEAVSQSLEHSGKPISLQNLRQAA